MSESVIVSGKTKQEKYQSLLSQIKSLVEVEKDFIANVSNIIAALKHGMNFLWVGIYFVKPLPHPQPLSQGRGEEELVLGPFQGPVACTRISFGKGVSGTAWKEKQTVIVEDVNKFSDHIACSSESKSEIVIPCFKSDEVFAVLDVDSEKLNNFDETDKKYLEEIGTIISQLAD
ncbi:MAG: GAF domain-containing protein [Bacteroidetes bacterium]|nr:GAF domain-containing protein [Bacteroidota bacterium]